MKRLRSKHENPRQSRFCFVEEGSPVIDRMIVQGQVHSAAGRAG